MNPGSFFVPTYDSERLKTLSVWSVFADTDLGFRPAPRARTPREHMVHQCVSEDTWMRNMLSITPAGSALPPQESRLSFIRHYAALSEARRDLLSSKPEEWWAGEVSFFDVRRTRAWVLLRRLTHSAHHRAQLTVYLRLLGRPVYSTYGPSADTGGLFQNQAPTVYRYSSIEDLLAGEEVGGTWPQLSGPGNKSPTERPEEHPDT